MPSADVPSQRRAGALLGYANIVVRNVVGLVYTPMVLYFVGQADYGVFQTASNFVVSLQLLTFGFSGTYVRFYMQRSVKGDEEGIRRLNGMYLAIYLGICALAIVLGLVLSGLSDALFGGTFSADQVSLAAAVMSVLTFNVATTLLSTVFDAYIVAHERFTFQQTRQMAAALLTPGIALLMLAVGWGVVGVAVAQLATSLILLGLNARYAIGKLGMRFDVRRWERGLFAGVAAFSGWVFLNQVFDLVTMNVPSVILAAVAGAAPVAVFAIAAQLRTVFYSLSLAISGMFVPLVNKIVAERDDNGELTRLMTRVGRYQALAWWWVLGGFIVLGRWFVEAWAGPEFSQAYWMTIAMVVPATVPLVQNTGIEIQKAKNRHKPRSVAYMVCAVVDLALTYLLAEGFGAWAAVLGYVVYIVLGSWAFMNWYYHARIGLDMAYFWKNVLPIVAVCAASSAVCLAGTALLPVTGIWTFLGWGVVYSAVSLPALWAFALNDDEKATFARVLGKTALGRRACGGRAARGGATDEGAADEGAADERGRDGSATDERGRDEGAADERGRDEVGKGNDGE